MILLLPSQSAVLNAYAVLVGMTPGNAAFKDHQAFINTAGVGVTGYKAALESYFAGTSTAVMASSLLTNLGLSASFTQAEAEAFLTANAGNRVGAMIDLAGSLYSYGGADVALSAAKTNYVNALESSYAFSNNANNVNGQAWAGVVGQELSLTTGFDNLMGTALADTFIARTINNSNTLNDRDMIDGGAGVDTLYVDFTNLSSAITPVLKNIENVVIRAQTTTTDATNGNNLGSNLTQLDAQRSLAVDNADQVIADTGVTRWESNGSRSDLVIEDVRIGNSQKTKDITIAMVDTDPGNVDFGVYFDQHSLRNSSTGNSTLTIQIMDTGAAATPATAATPLLNNPYDTFKLGINGVLATIVLDPVAVAAADTYAQLLTVFNAALVGTGVTASLSGTFTITDPLSGLQVTGQNLVLSSSGSSIITTPAGSGWYNTTGAAVPASSNIYTTYANAASSTVELVTSTVVLDNVGRGSTGGDLLIGGMSVGTTSTSRGVERFEITVQDSSKLQTINSTNNALREVTIVNGTTSNVSSAYNTVVADAGNLTVNGTAGTADAELPGSSTNSTWGGAVGAVATATHSGTGAAGFTDVRLIDASTMKGSLAFTAAITTDSLSKYVTMTDTASSPTADVAGTGNVNFNVKGANFAYSGGSGNDTMNVTIDSAVAASKTLTGQSDFTIVLDGGAGNDVITTNFGGNETAAWLVDQAANNNITINGGDGNDTITTTGAGKVNINAGAGNDTVYTDNSGTKAAWTVNNATGATIGDLQTDGSVLGSTLANGFLFGGKLTVSFAGAVGLAAAAAAGSVIGTGTNGYEVTVDIPTGTNYSVNQFYVNQAIKAAVNLDPVLSKLLVATDGPSNVLVITSLIDGAEANTALSLTVSHKAMVSTDTAAITAYQAFIGDNTATFTAANTAMDAAGTGTVAVANAVLGMSAAGAGAGSVQITAGADSTAISDNIINMGSGTDVLVLGSTEGVSAAASSNDVVVFASTGFNTTIVNYDMTGFGSDMLHFKAFLGDQTLVTGYNVTTATTTAAAAAGAATTLASNEVFVMSGAGFNTTTATFAGLTGPLFLAAVNSGTAYGNIVNASLAPTSGGTVVGGVGHSVVLVENNLNLGQYDVFQMTWTADGTAQTLFTGATLVGTMDVGTSLAAFTVGTTLA